MAENNPNARLETFVDGVMAIAITLLVLEIKAPKSEDVHSAKDLWHAIAETWPYWFAFLLSFGTILIAWVNHHNFFKYIDKTSTPFIYANGFFMFTYVTLPFTTALLAENMMTDHFAPAVFLYTFNSLLGNVAWNVLFFV
ncbi:MAG TPA: TMEM175 family protein, partial [Bacteroidia bacterium]|nr:TMEM175 family protein [Bacteroidia bacterium]